jgi:hypothetical protein
LTEQRLVTLGLVAVAVGILGSPALTSDCTGTSTGLIPLTHLGQGLYQGFEGGLYPGGSDQLPAGHLTAGLLAAQQVQPLDAAGQPSAGGAIGMVSFGFSNTSLEFNALRQLAALDPDLHPSLVLVDGARHGTGAQQMADPLDSYWTLTVPFRLLSAGITAEQVQVGWLKNSIPLPNLPFPQDAQLLQGYLTTVVQILHQQFPNLKILYVSSRAYAGYASTHLSPEPFAYEDGFAVKWMIEAQIQGDPALNFDPQQGLVVAPWLAWGPYLWADGLLRRSDGLSYACDDFWPGDGTHPDPGANSLISDLLLEFIKGDDTARPWSLALGVDVCGLAAFVDLYGEGTTGTGGGPRIAVNDRPTIDQAGLAILVENAIPNQLGAFFLGVQSFSVGEVPFAGGWLLVDPFLILLRSTDSAGRVSLTGFPLTGDPLLCGANLYGQYAVLDPLGPSGQFSLSRGLQLLFGQ